MDVPLNKLAFWVMVMKILAGFFTEEVERMLGNFIRKFLEYDGSNKGSVWLTFMRVQLEVDVTQPLKRKKSLKLANGQSKSSEFKYKRLNLFCFIYRMLDHTESYCDIVFEADETEIEKKWGRS